MKKLIILIFIILNSQFLTAEETLDLRIGIYENPPKIFTSHDGKISGFWADITNYIAEKENWNIHWVHGSWEQCLQRLENNEIDIMVDTGVTPDRMKRFLFSTETVLLSWTRLYTQKGAGLESILDLEGKKIAGLRESINVEGPEGLRDIINKFGITCEIVEMDDYSQVFQALHNKEIFAGITNNYYGTRHETEYDVERSAIIFQPSSLKYSFSKNSGKASELIKKIDNNIKTLKNDKNSVYYSSMEKYLGGVEKISFFPFWLKLIIAAILILLFIFYLFILLLKLQVKKKTAELEMTIEEREKTEKDLHLKERIHGTLINNLPGVAYRCKYEKNWTMIYMSEGCKEITGYINEDFIDNRNVAFSDIIDPDYNQKINNIREAALPGKTTFECEYPIITKNHQKRWVWEKGCGIYSDEDSLLFLEGFITDITERKHAEEELHKMQKLKSIGILAGGIAHDFNNILTGVYGNLSIAKMHLSKNDPAFQFLEKAEKSISRATQLTKQLLTFSRGGAPLKEKTDISEIVEEVVRFDLSGSNVKPVFKKSDNLWPLEVDIGQMQQVFSNLTINADHAMPDGGHLYITLENSKIEDNSVLLLKPGKYIKITVKDEGIGIDKKYFESVFDPFFTTKKTGNGLGLATVYSIIKQHNGSITIDSKKGDLPDGEITGTAFTIYLPASIPETVAETVEKKAEDSAEVKSAKILVMDDEDMICKVVTAILTKKGYSVKTAPDGKKTIELFQHALESNNPFDAVIMDLTVPGGMGGEEAVKKILSIDPDARVIVSSGYADDHVMANYAQYGFKGILKKPFVMDNLLETLKQVLDK